MKQQTRKVRQHICFYGRVQGVGFRFRASQLADRMGLTGWVRNEEDYVEMEVQGDPLEIRCLIGRLQTSPWIVIESYEAEEIPVEESEWGFQVDW